MRKSPVGVSVYQHRRVEEKGRVRRGWRGEGKREVRKVRRGGRQDGGRVREGREGEMWMGVILILGEGEGEEEVGEGRARVMGVGFLWPWEWRASLRWWVYFSS